MMAQGFRVLQQFAKSRKPLERCELCATPVSENHEHLIDPVARKIVCSCHACAILFSDQQAAKFKRIPRNISLLENFEITDAEWDSLMIPIGLAFFFYSTPEKKTIAVYPSPAGPMESLLKLETWEEIIRKNEKYLLSMQSDVEALLVNRVRQNRESYRVPIDECYKLVGIIRANWRGLSGGTEVWSEIASFFAELRKRAHVVQGEIRA
jgi:hypothetical protein